MIRVKRNGFSGVCDNLGDVVMSSFVKDNFRIKTSVNGNIKWYRYWDLLYCNVSHHPMYKCILDKSDMSIVVDRFDF